MVPACFPSKISSTTGLREAVVYALSSVTGLVRWTDYIPVKLVASADAALEGRTDAGGFIPMDMLSSNTGLMGWVDYLPVYVDNSATDAWAITATGFIPYAASGGGSSPAFTVTMTALTNALGTVTTLAYINGGGGGGTITISATTTTLTGTAPFNVVFDASGTTATGVSKPFRHLFYVWDFGDDQSTYWANGAYVNQNKNTEYGPIASHVFQNSGTKTVTLYVYDGSGNVATQTFTVTVNAADTTYSGTNTICIANGTAVTAGTGGAPSGCTSVGGISDFNSALSTYRGANKRIMFKRGDTFTVPASTWTDINVSGMHICAFGSGADPIINVGANTFGLRVGASAGASVLSVYDLEFRGGNNTNNLGIGGAANIDNLLFLRCKVDNFSNGIMSFGKSEIEAGSLKKMWENLAVVDCTLDHVYGGVSGSGHNTAFMSANKFTWMGNYVDNRGGGSHVLRTPYITQACVKHNYFAGQGSEGGYECWKIHGPNWADAGGAISPGSYTEYINAGNNVFVGGVGGGWIVSLGPQATPTDERLRHILLDGNYIKRGDLAGSVCINIRGNVSNVAVRNNVFNMSVAATGFAMDISGYTSDSASGVGANTLDVINNTAYSSTSGMTTTGLFNFGGNPVDCRFINNLVYTPAMGSMGVVAASGGSGWVASNNSSNAQAIGTNPSFSTIPAFATNHLLTTDFKPSTSRTHGAGIADVAIRDDLFHITRTGTMDLGAVQA